MEILKSILERASSPLFGPFAISWCIVNWRVLLIMFTSGLLANEKIAYIESISNKHIMIYWPLFWAILYILLMPLLLYAFRRLYSEPLKKLHENLANETEREVELRKNLGTTRNIILTQIVQYAGLILNEQKAHIRMMGNVLSDPSFNDQGKLSQARLTIGSFGSTVAKYEAAQSTSQEVKDIIDASNNPGTIDSLRDFGNQIKKLKNDLNRFYEK